eukprot:TRINITY_DN209_c2_g2_i3.p3 TRINITY_DN209_c2_g2~~TRINITY_DN209_c2_g2_i3.p3  ORF type:complete len:128 (-),score=28.97 TRINITY_DN209_c2_g2_i3:205-588(-)
MKVPLGLLTDFNEIQNGVCGCTACHLLWDNGLFDVAITFSSSSSCCSSSSSSSSSSVSDLFCKLVIQVPESVKQGASDHLLALDKKVLEYNLFCAGFPPVALWQWRNKWNERKRDHMPEPCKCQFDI